jgi:hypothetical protein
MARKTVDFSNRPAHKLRYEVTSELSADSKTVTFSWTFSIITSGNTRGPYGTGNYTNSTSPTTAYVPGTLNNQTTNFSYDYRGNFNRDYDSFGTGQRTAAAGSGNRIFRMTVNMGGLIGSATAEIEMPVPAAPVEPPPIVAAEGSITATAVSQTAISVAWSTTNNPTSTTVSGPGLTTRNEASGTVNATGLSPNTTYTYTISTFNEANASNPSVTTASARTLLPSPTLSITATTLTSTTARVVWSTTNATSANISGPNLSSTETSGNEIVEGLTRNTVYRWSGTASNADSSTGTVQSNQIQTLNVVGGVWTGTVFAVPAVKVWTGSSWDTKEAKVWTGSQWKIWV